MSCYQMKTPCILKPLINEPPKGIYIRHKGLLKHLLNTLGVCMPDRVLGNVDTEFNRQ